MLDRPHRVIASRPPFFEFSHSVPSHTSPSAKVGPLQPYPSPTRLPPAGPLQPYPSPTTAPPTGPLQPYPSPTTAPPAGQLQPYPSPTRLPPAGPLQPYPSPTTAPPAGPLQPYPSPTRLPLLDNNNPALPQLHRPLLDSINTNPTPTLDHPLLEELSQLLIKLKRQTSPHPAFSARASTTPTTPICRPTPLRQYRETH